MGINFQRLLDVCRATEELPLGGFNMAHVCGSAGCMIGNYNALVPSERAADEYAKFQTNSDGVKIWKPDWDHFGITKAEYLWLFGHGASRYSCTDYKWPLPTDYGGWASISVVRQEQALARVRKFIYYKLRKQEFIVDEKYGVRQEARTKEGNHGFTARAVRETAEVMCGGV